MNNILGILIILISIVSLDVYGNSSEATFKELDYIYENIPLGILQKDFKKVVPSKWSPTPSMFSYEQNINPVGEINNGYFYYEFGNNDNLPLMRFQFWNKKLAYIEIILFTFNQEENVTNENILKNQIDKFNLIYGELYEESDDKYNDYSWKRNKYSTNIRFFPKKDNNSQTVGSLEIRLKDNNVYSEMNTFATKRNEIKYYDEYYASIMCEQKLQSGTIFEFGFFYDTRLLSEEKANEYKNTIQKVISNENINCMSELTQVSEFDKEWLDITLPSQKSVMDTYLSFKTLDGINAWGQFFAGEYTDAMCENYQKGLIQSGIEAECIYGHDIK
jgi:hypothetical protein